MRGKLGAFLKDKVLRPLGEKLRPTEVHSSQRGLNQPCWLPFPHTCPQRAPVLQGAVLREGLLSSPSSTSLPCLPPHSPVPMRSPAAAGATSATSCCAQDAPGCLGTPANCPLAAQAAAPMARDPQNPLGSPQPAGTCQQRGLSRSGCGVQGVSLRAGLQRSHPPTRGH